VIVEEPNKKKEVIHQVQVQPIPKRYHKIVKSLSSKLMKDVKTGKRWCTCGCTTKECKLQHKTEFRPCQNPLCKFIHYHETCLLTSFYNPQDAAQADLIVDLKPVDEWWCPWCRLDIPAKECVVFDVVRACVV